MRRPAPAPGDRVGNFEVVEILAYRRNARLRVRDMRCGHENVVTYATSRGYAGSRSRCNCPIRYIDRKGYAWWRWSGPTGGTIRVPEHHIVWQGANRQMRPGEEVHHKNGSRADNRLGNLELWVVKQPKGQRPEDLVEYALEILSLYAPEIQLVTGGALCAA